MDWRQAEILELISMYRESDFLWNPLSSGYRDLDLKKSTWKEFADHFGKDIAEVKKKIKNLRTSYVVEKKKVESIKATEGKDSAYEPRLFYYDEMIFLDPFIVLRASTILERNGQPAIQKKPTCSLTEKSVGPTEKKRRCDYDDVEEELPIQELSPTKTRSEQNSTSFEVHAPQIDLEDQVDHVEPSKEETFCAMLCSELKLIRSEDVYDKVTSEIFAIVKSAKATERQKMY